MHLKKAKCKFQSRSIEYLGYQISAEGLRATDSKWQPLYRSLLQDLRSFLGLLNYYGKFIPNLAFLLHPLNALLHHYCKWKWSDRQKKKLISSSVLSLTIGVAADTSAYENGAVILHVVDGNKHPIAFASRTLTTAERNYTQVEREVLGLIFAVKKFHNYLNCHKFTLITDHHNPGTEGHSTTLNSSVE